MSPPRTSRRLVMLRENALMAFETLRGNVVRSLLTILGVFIGVVIVTAVASVLNGFRQSIVDQVTSFGTNNIYIYRFPFVQAGDSNRSLRSRKPIRLADALAIKETCPSVAFVAPGLEYPEIFATARSGGERMDSPVLRGVFPDAERVMNAVIREGRFLTAVENDRSADVAVLGHNVAEALFANRSALGKSLEVAGNRYEVIGVLEKQKDSPFGESNREDSLILVPYGAFHKHHSGMDDHFVACEARPGKLLDAVEEITELLRRRRKVRYDEENNFEIGTANSIIETFDQIVFGAVAVMFILSSVAFLVGGVGVMNIMLASVKERTAEIGMRKAIGARRRDIAWQFLVEAMTLTGAGGILGMMFIDLLGLTVRTFWASLPIATPLWARVVGFSGSVGVGLIFGMWPALKASRLDPVEALRHE